MSATTSTTSAAAASGWAKAPIIPAMPALVMAPPARSRSATSGSPRARSHPQPRAAQSPQKPPVAADGARPMLAMEILPALANAAGCVPSELDESRRCPSFQDTWRFRLLRRPADPRASRLYPARPLAECSNRAPPCAPWGSGRNPQVRVRQGARAVSRAIHVRRAAAALRRRMAGCPRSWWRRRRPGRLLAGRAEQHPLDHRLTCSCGPILPCR